MKRFEQQVAVISGGAAGIGLATARRIGGEGGRVALLDWAAADLEAAVDELTRRGIDCVGVRGDVARAEDCEAVVALALERWDRLDVVVANAGVRATGTVLDSRPEDWERLIAVNLRGVVNTCAAAADAIRECKTRGAMVLVSSVHAEVGRAEMAIYDATKAAILSLARSLAIELAPEGIRVNSICPGFTLTDYHLRRAEREGRPAGELERAAPGLFQRPARPDEIAAAIAFLASGDASYITATNLMVDAGVHAT